jgi:hypothetical protein
MIRIAVLAAAVAALAGLLPAQAPPPAPRVSASYG